MIHAITDPTDCLVEEKRTRCSASSDRTGDERGRARLGNRCCAADLHTIGYAKTVLTAGRLAASSLRLPAGDPGIRARWRPAAAARSPRSPARDGDSPGSDHRPAGADRNAAGQCASSTGWPAPCISRSAMKSLRARHRWRCIAEDAWQRRGESLVGSANLVGLPLTAVQQWSRRSDAVAWAIDFRGDATRVAHEVTIDLPMLTENSQVFTPTERGVMESQRIRLPGTALRHDRLGHRTEPGCCRW